MRILDLFCGAGGAAMGYHRAGWEVVGVDIRPQPRYPFEFHHADALEVLDRLLAGEIWQGYQLRSFKLIHTSPPCQHASALGALSPHKSYPRLIEPTRERLLRTGRPWVIENVMPAKLLYGVTLCGGMFGLRTYRHRRFETSHLLFQPFHPRHVTRTATKRRREAWEAGQHVSITGDVGTYLAAEAMGIDWMTGAELSEAIPPAYTEWLGKQLAAALAVAA